MAEAARRNFYVQPGTIFNVQFKEATINMRQYTSQQTDRDIIMSSRQAIFAFIVAVWLNFLQLKYQGKAESPFQTRPKTMLVAVASLFMYCLAYDAKLRSSSLNHNNNYSVYIYTCSMAIFGPLSLASISSVLLPEFFCPFLFLVAILFSLCQFPRFEIERMFKRLQAAIKNKFCHQEDYRGRRRSRGGMVSVQVPWLPEHAIMNQVDILPPV